MKQKIKNEIIKILNDCEYWQPKMIIEEKEPFFWEINPDWLEDKSNRLSELFEKQKQEIVEEIEKYAGKVFGFEVVISENRNDKRYIAGFEAGKKFLLEEVIKLIDKL